MKVVLTTALATPCGRGCSRRGKVCVCPNCNMVNLGRCNTHAGMMMILVMLHAPRRPSIRPHLSFCRYVAKSRPENGYPPSGPRLSGQHNGWKFWCCRPFTSSVSARPAKRAGSCCARARMTPCLVSRTPSLCHPLKHSAGPLLQSPFFLVIVFPL